MILRRGRRLPSKQRAILILPFWMISSFWMWSWWLSQDSINLLILYILLTAAMIYEFTLLPTAFIYFLIRAKKPRIKFAPANKKVAVISPCVPSSESLDIIEAQLIAMTKIKYPHDSWILDEGGRKEIKRLARKHGVKYFTRKGIRKYNQEGPPYKKKTKAGNVNAWLNHVKRYKYEFFVQLDIDHIPKENYLHKTLGYFKDPTVAWVQAPSIYNNFDNWIARGAAEQELALQGPLQMGFFGHSSTPFIIGSHTTYRTSAIREIGGYQPTRAEDHLDTVCLASKGYKGIYLPEVIAEGKGPETLNIYLSQQFAWGYSMMQVLMGHTPKLLKGMSLKQKFQFIFSQTWYPFWSLSYLILFIAPIIALLTGLNPVEVNGGQMLIHFIPIYIGGFAVWWAGRPIMQPTHLRLSWRGIILHSIRWPVLLRAVLEAALKIKRPYMVTPKGHFAKSVPSVKTYRTFLTLGFISSAAIILQSLSEPDSSLAPQVIFAFMSSIMMFSVCALDIGFRLKKSRPSYREIRLNWYRPIGVTATLLLVANLTAVLFLSKLNPQVARAESDNSSIIYTQPPPVKYGMNTKLFEKQISLTAPNSDPLPTIGMYNTSDDLPKSSRKYIQHSFVSWEDNYYFGYVLAKTLQNNNVPLITVKPETNASGFKLLTDITNGVYDQRIDKLVNLTSKSKNPVYIRFAHEMELHSLYPWGAQPPKVYIDAYKHFVDRFRLNANSKAKFVWSPAGNEGAIAYYPGDDYVDVIGTTVLHDAYWYGSYRISFNELIYKRLWLKQIGKPVWITELGAGSSDPVFQTELINDALHKYQSLGFQTLIYLNMKDANIQGPDYSLRSIHDFAGIFSRPASKISTVVETPTAKPKIEDETAKSRDPVKFPKLLESIKTK